MQLDSSRNHIILVNLWLSMISISVMATTILPAFFGMNLQSGVPDQTPEHFYMVGGRPGRAHAAPVHSRLGGGGVGGNSLRRAFQVATPPRHTHTHTHAHTHTHTHTHPARFRQVVGASVALAATSFPIGRWWYFRHWRRMTQQELFEQKMLRCAAAAGPPGAPTTHLRGLAASSCPSSCCVGPLSGNSPQASARGHWQHSPARPPASTTT